MARRRAGRKPPWRDKRIFFPLLAVALVLEIAADWFSKSWSIGGPTPFIIYSVSLYVVGALIMVNAMRVKTLAQTVPVFVISTSIVAAAMGAFMFGERLSPLAVIGMATGIAAVLLINHDD
ncbi:Uncharacterised protein [uncultured archaeon]|nr:Uncharacterised protein [uncultured archaeon]